MRNTYFALRHGKSALSGLSWLTILRKRENYRKAFDHFDAKKIACYSEARQRILLGNEGIVRNRLKIAAVIKNAKAFLAIQKEYGNFDRYVWGFTEGKWKGKSIPRRKRNDALKVSGIMSRELKKCGFTFVGATICFAFMQAIGMVDDHEPRCFRRAASE